MSLLLDLSCRGGAVAIAVSILDRAFAGRVAATTRRWWWMFVPLAFLVPLRVTLLPAEQEMGIWPGGIVRNPPEYEAVTEHASARHDALAHWAMILWLAGAIVFLLLRLIQTWRVLNRISRERLSTDPVLMDLVEDCKVEAGVRAPIGLVVSSTVASPALLGYLRPRILLPESLAREAAPDDLRPIILHELAHFRGWDVPFNFLLTVARSVHWFNPAAHFGAAVWSRFREEAADERAAAWMGDPSGLRYSEALVRMLRLTHGIAAPLGSLGILESARHLKRRLELIQNRRQRRRALIPAALIGVLLGAVVCARPAAASASVSSDPAVAAIPNSERWLAVIDRGDYAESWRQASAFYRRSTTLERYEEIFANLRVTLGKCQGRRYLSSFLQKNGPKVPTYADVEFESSYANLRHAIDIVSLCQEPDGSWKVGGYRVHPALKSSE